MPALVRLARKDAVNMRQFTVASQLSATAAKALRVELARQGLLVAKVLRSQGATEVYEISLTPLGRRVAAHLIAVRELLAGPPREG